MAPATFVAFSGKESVVCAVIPCSLVKNFLRVCGTCFLVSNSWEEEVGVRGTCMVSAYTYCRNMCVCVCLCVCVCVILPGGQFALGRSFVPCQPFSKINPSIHSRTYKCKTNKLCIFPTQFIFVFLLSRTMNSHYRYGSLNDGDTF